ncbi:peptidase inhibitor family I36 protein [Streptomyces sp. NPDC059009]|uniref:peptidase inhibitor family I36 protein n=1 Tax=Streptomyces sp. NPDC059009 TaxID=3346694 RepID=UPI003698A5CF
MGGKGSRALAVTLLAGAMLFAGGGAGGASAAESKAAAGRFACDKNYMCLYSKKGGDRSEGSSERHISDWSHSKTKCRSGRPSVRPWIWKPTHSIWNRTGKTWYGHSKKWGVKLRVKPGFKVFANPKYKHTIYWCHK